MQQYNSYSLHNSHNTTKASNSSRLSSSLSKTEKLEKSKYTKTIGNIPYNYNQKFTYNNCNNCGKSGHVFHQCKMPIMSIGIILFRVVPIQKILPPPGFDISNELILNTNTNELNNRIEYLIIRRKETLGYIDFMRGKYSIQNKDYIMNMLKQMTNEEKELLRCKDFDLLWKKIWGQSANNSQYKSEEINSREKYYTLINGVKLHNDYYNLDDLIDYSSAYQLWEEPEWGFPKGRRNNQENDFDCAVREFSEETGYSSDKLVFLQNVLPYEEIFTGSNYKSYKHKYFLMYMNYDDSLNIGQYQTSEVSMIAWKTFEECIQYFRPYNLEKIRILNKVNSGLKHHLLH